MPFSTSSSNSSGSGGIVFAIAAAALFMAWTYTHPAPVPPFEVSGYGIDPTTALDCDRDLRPLIHDGLAAGGEGTVFFFRSGGENDEPVILAKVAKPTGAKTSPYDQTTLPAIEGKRKVLEDELVGKCRDAMANPPGRSPIRRLVVRMVEALPAACPTDRPCTVTGHVISDLDEKSKDKVVGRGVPELQAAAFARLTFCGTALPSNDAAKKRRNKKVAQVSEAQINARVAIWRKALPGDNVIFQGFCSGAGVAVGDDAGGAS